MSRAAVADAAACGALLLGAFVAGVVLEHCRPLGTRWAYAQIDSLVDVIGDIRTTSPGEGARNETVRHAAKG